MRRWSLAVLSTLVVAPSLASAEPPVARAVAPAEDAETVAGFAKAALSMGEPGAFDALMGPTVRYDLRGLSPCSGVGRKGNARGGKRAKLAQCVVERVRGLEDSFRYRVVRQGRSKDRFQVEVPVDRHQLVLDLRPVSGDMVVVAVMFRENEQPVEVLRSWDGEEGGVEGGVYGGEVGGVIGGVPGGVVGGIALPPPPPPPPPPPAPPQILAPTVLEQLRVSGDVKILPDATTKAAIVASGKTRIVAPVKLCVDRTGVVTSAVVLKSTGFPAYDATLKAGVLRWRYQPVVINGAPAPVCSVTTFIYTVTP